MDQKSGSKKHLVFLGIIVLLVVVLAIGYIAKGRTGKKIITQGDTAPDFRLPTADGAQVSLASLRGKVVMVHFWATWCPPCVEEIPTLDKLYRSFAGSDFEMLAVSVDEGGPSDVAAFMQKNALNIPVLFDPGRSVASLYGTYKFPETYILDREGVVRIKVIGPRNWTDPKIIQDVQALLGK
jgi:peroxiredoxin